MASVKLDLNTSIINKLQELGAYFDDELPNFIVMLIEKDKSMNEIREDLSMILDQATDDFIEWLGKYLENERETSKEPISATRVPTISLDTALDEDQLDFEENLDEEEQIESYNNINNKEEDDETKQDGLTTQPKPTSFEPTENDTKTELNANAKRPHFNVDADKQHTNSDPKPKVIKLNSGEHLNDIGLMRRKVALNQQLTSNLNSNSAVHNRIGSNLNSHRATDTADDDDVTDLREKLNRMRKLHRPAHESNQNENDQDQTMDTESNENSNEEKKEKCRFWPLCKNGSNCVFFHPTEQCIAFPSCKLGEKCMFIHPLCKFDAVCTKKDCPFTHIAKKTVAPHPPASTPLCKFYPNCFNASCPFLHPKMCMFGSHCKNAACPFTHPEPKTAIAKPHQLKWSSKKENGEASENKEPNPMPEADKPEEQLVVVIKDSSE